MIGIAARTTIANGYKTLPTATLISDKPNDFKNLTWGNATIATQGTIVSGSLSYDVPANTVLSKIRLGSGRVPDFTNQGGTVNTSTLLYADWETMCNSLIPAGTTNVAVGVKFGTEIYNFRLLDVSIINSTIDELKGIQKIVETTYPGVDPETPNQAMYDFLKDDTYIEGGLEVLVIFKRTEQPDKVYFVSQSIFTQQQTSENRVYPVTTFANQVEFDLSDHTAQPLTVTLATQLKIPSITMEVGVV